MVYAIPVALWASFQGPNGSLVVVLVAVAIFYAAGLRG